MACHEEGTTTYLPKPQTPPSQAKGLFPRLAFRYQPERNNILAQQGNGLRGSLNRKRKHT